MALLEAHGWVVARSAGSHGSADLVAMRAGDTPMLVQVKGGGGSVFKTFGPAERIQLKADAAKAAAIPILCRLRENPRRWEFIDASAWPQDTPVRRLPDYIVDSRTGCWLWQKAQQADGYGICTRNGASCLAHRAYYEQHVGLIPRGLQIDHLCRVRACVNPDHLEPVTQVENRLRGALTRLTAKEIRGIRAANGSLREIAVKYGVDKGYVWRIRKGFARKDVPYDDAPAR